MKFYVDVAVPPLPNLLSYKVDSDSAEAQVGSRITVPLGRRTSIGYIVNRSETSSYKIASDSQTSFLEEDSVKPIDYSIPPEPCFSPSQLNFFKKVSNYYGSSLSQVIDVAVPQSAPCKKIKIITLIQGDNLEGLGKSGKAREIIQILKEHNGQYLLTELNRRIKSSGPILKKLSSLNIISIKEQDDLESVDALGEKTTWAQTEVTLNSFQKSAVNEITKSSSAGEFKTFLLHGITGSGKTEVYIEAAREVLANGKAVIVIVPEIALTPQLIDRFRARLGDNIGTLHSGLHKRIRWDSWQRLLNKKSFMAIGARSAIFAPVENIGLIIVDEEHDGSFKQSEGLRYNARDMAIMRAQLENCPVVLGSATPSLESYYRARSGKYKLLELPVRHAASQELPIEVVDLRTIKPWEMPSQNISPALLKEIENTIAKREQVFLLYNRRGFASFLQCEKCGESVECPQCSVSLTYHQFRNSLVCHYCGVTNQPMEFCPKCLAKKEPEPGKLTQRGGGTERVFEEVANLFPDAQVDRLDRDTATDIESYKSILNKVRAGETAILVGTQMIAKGHDLPNVTLVGVVDCDVGIHMPDFRASERAFQLLTQVAGRAGRGAKAGKVILQTRTPHHAAIRKTVENDFIGFAKLELGQRQKLNYPPFNRLLRIVAASGELENIEPYLTGVRAEIEKLITEQSLPVQILGPSPAPLQKIKGLYRFHLLLKSNSGAALNKIIHGVCLRLKSHSNMRLIFDMDPYEML
jgi:primosomal protein N' (replication factor Y)